MDIKKAFTVMKSMQFVEVHECGFLEWIINL